MHIKRIMYAIWAAMVEMPLPPEYGKTVERTDQTGNTQLVIIGDELYKITVERLTK